MGKLCTPTQIGVTDTLVGDDIISFAVKCDIAAQKGITTVRYVKRSLNILLHNDRSRAELCNQTELSKYFFRTN